MRRDQMRCTGDDAGLRSAEQFIARERHQTDAVAIASWTVRSCLIPKSRGPPARRFRDLRRPSRRHAGPAAPIVLRSHPA